MTKESVSTSECAHCGCAAPDNCMIVVHSAYAPDANVCNGCIEGDDFVYAEDADGLWDVESLTYISNAEHEGYFVEPPSTGIQDSDADVLHFTGYKAIVKGNTVPLRNNRNLLYGVELEVDAKDDNDSDTIANDLMESTDFGNYGIAKFDSTCTGPELVTMPADLFSHKHTLPWDIWCKNLRESSIGYAGTDNGIHIHVNKAAITPLTLGKLLVFMNSESNMGLLDLVAQRDISTSIWCKPNAPFFNKVGKSGKIRHGYETPEEKYSIVNITRKTLEFRMFKSNLLPERILKNIEFCDALVNWCRKASAARLTKDSFLAYVATNRKEYSNLHTFITKRLGN